MTLSKRALKAQAVLKAGGYFRNQLERTYHGGEQFTTRLRDHLGQVVPGYGFKTHLELEKAGVLRTRDCPRSTVWPTEWVLRQRTAP